MEAAKTDPKTSHVDESDMILYILTNFFCSYVVDFSNHMKFYLIIYVYEVSRCISNFSDYIGCLSRGPKGWIVKLCTEVAQRWIG